jgi:hypothetical protein
MRWGPLPTPKWGGASRVRAWPGDSHRRRVAGSCRSPIRSFSSQADRRWPVIMARSTAGDALRAWPTLRRYSHPTARVLLYPAAECRLDGAVRRSTFGSGPGVTMTRRISPALHTWSNTPSSSCHRAGPPPPRERITGRARSGRSGGASATGAPRDAKPRPDDRALYWAAPGRPAGLRPVPKTVMRSSCRPRENRARRTPP